MLLPSNKWCQNLHSCWFHWMNTSWAFLLLTLFPPEFFLFILKLKCTLHKSLFLRSFGTMASLWRPQSHFQGQVWIVDRQHFWWASQVALAVRNPPANARDVGSIPGLGRSLGVGNGNPLQYSFLEDSMDRRSWWATIHGGPKESDTTKNTRSSLDKLYAHPCSFGNLLLSVRVNRKQILKCWC